MDSIKYEVTFSAALDSFNTPTDESAGYVSAKRSDLDYALVGRFNPKLAGDRLKALRDLAKKVANDSLNHPPENSIDLTLEFSFPQTNKTYVHTFDQEEQGKGRIYGLNENQQNLFSTLVAQNYKGLQKEKLKGAAE